MRPTPVALFVVGTLSLVGGLGVAAMHDRSPAGEASAAVPSDASRFGFVVRRWAGDVALLEATQPFRIPLANGPVRGEPPAAFDAVADLVTRELARYPAAFVRKVRLGGVVLVRDLAENDMPIPSLPNVGGLLLLDASSAPADLVRSFHHEVYHFFDLADDGRVGSDPRWDALNPPGFAYGSGGRTLRGAWAARPAVDLPGFVSAYATSGPEEDKAETFAFAVARAPLLEERVAIDPALRAKVLELSRRLSSFDPECPGRLGLDAIAHASEAHAR